MVGFNLLPQRELLLAKVVKKWQRIIGGVFLFTVILCLSIHQWLTNQLTEAAFQESSLQAEIDALVVLKKENNENDEKGEVLAKYQITARDYLTHTARLLSMLAQQSKKTVCFTSLQRHKQEWVWQGYALSIDDLLLQLKRWKKSDGLMAIEVSNMRWLVSDNVLSFEIKANEGKAFSFS